MLSQNFKTIGEKLIEVERFEAPTLWETLENIKRVYLKTTLKKKKWSIFWNKNCDFHLKSPPKIQNSFFS